MTDKTLKLLPTEPTSNLLEALELLKEKNPLNYIVIFLDPSDDKVVVSSWVDKKGTRMTQLGMLEMAKDIILNYED